MGQGNRRPLRTEPLARWEGRLPVEALEPSFAPLEWVESVRRFVDRARAIAPFPDEPVCGWKQAASVVGVSERHLMRLAVRRPDCFAYDRGWTTLRECRHAFLAIVIRGVLRQSGAQAGTDIY